MRVLDLFCGMGGWSIGFHREGFECVGVDIVDVGYPYEFIQKDVRDYHPVAGEFDAIVESPPCNEFTKLRLANKKTPPNPEKGLELVREGKRVIEEANPKYWAIENVQGALKHFYPLLGSPSLISPPWYVWGRFPRFLMPSSNRFEKAAHLSYDGRKKGNKGSWLNDPGRHNPMRSWIRARIPLPLSLALARACKESLTV